MIYTTIYWLENAVAVAIPKWSSTLWQTLKLAAPSAIGLPTLIWNDGDDIMEAPLHIFWDDPQGYLQGEVVAIHIADDEFKPVTQQSINFMEAIIEYGDKKLGIEHDDSTIDIGEFSSFNPEIYCYTIRPENAETIKFEKVVIAEGNRIVRLEFRWNDTWLFIVAEQHNLVITRDIVPYDVESPSVDGDKPLHWS